MTKPEQRTDPPATNASLRGVGWAGAPQPPRPEEPPPPKFSFRLAGMAALLILAVISVFVMFFGRKLGLIGLPMFIMALGGWVVLLRRGQRRDMVEGQARNVNQRNDQGRSMVLSFRLERYDHQGNRQAPFPVEMRGKSIRGTIEEGDQVRVRAKGNKDKVQRVKRARNLTSGVTVRAGLGLSDRGCLATLALTALGLTVVLFLLRITGLLHKILYVLG